MRQASRFAIVELGLFACGFETSANDITDGYTSESVARSGTIAP